MVEVCLRDYEENREVDVKEVYNKFVKYISNLGLPVNVVNDILILEAAASEEFEHEYFRAGFEYGKKMTVK